jgi:benzoylformate decarboxylase
MGPVYVCLPEDVLDAECVEPIRPTSIPSTRVAPNDATVQVAAKMLADGKRPIIFIGDGVAFSGAQPELKRVAELLGAEVWEADAGEVNFPYDHALYQGMTGHMFGFASAPIMARGDVNLVVGTYLLPEVFPALDDIFAPGASVIHIDLNAYEIAKNHPVDLGVVADPKLTLAKVADALELLLTPSQRHAARERMASLGSQRHRDEASARAADSAARDATPVRMSRFMEDLAPLLPDDAIVFNEALTNSAPIVRYRPPTRPGDYFLTRGGSLGIGIPGAIGAKLANPERTVIGFSGDGGAMYTIQALWSAARHDVAAKFVVCNNGSYRLLQNNITQFWKERGMAAHDFPLAFDLSSPPLHFDEMARAMGMQGVRVEKPWEVEPAIKQMLAHPGPFLIDLVVEGSTRPELIRATCGQ